MWSFVLEKEAIAVRIVDDVEQLGTTCGRCLLLSLAVHAQKVTELKLL
jgi:hypothetical protein